MTEEGLDFRATKDIDLVLIIEAVDANFGKKFWEYVKQAGYEHCNKSSGVPQFYRFSHPISNQYPAMIELFTRKLDAIQLPEDAVLTPLPMDDDISSLSAILLDNDCYEFLKQGKVVVDGVTVLDAAYLIPFKAKAWMDLTDRKAAGEHVDSKNIKKHKNDVFRLTELIDPTAKIVAPQLQNRRLPGRIGQQKTGGTQLGAACFCTSNIAKQTAFVNRCAEMRLRWKAAYFFARYVWLILGIDRKSQGDSRYS